MSPIDAGYATIPVCVRAGIDCHVAAVTDRECVGLLFGQGCEITVALPLTNLIASATAFAVCPDEISRIIAREKVLGRAVIGRYHSHANRRITPSLADRASLPAGWTELIVRVAWRGGKLEVSGMQLFDGEGLLIPMQPVASASRM